MHTNGTPFLPSGSSLWALPTYGIVLLTCLRFCNLGMEYLGEIVLMGHFVESPKFTSLRKLQK